MLVSRLLALLRGFTNEVLSIAWVVGALAALWLFPYLTPVLRGVISPEWLAAAIAAVGMLHRGLRDRRGAHRAGADRARVLRSGRACSTGRSASFSGWRADC